MFIICTYLCGWKPPCGRTSSAQNRRHGIKAMKLSDYIQDGGSMSALRAGAQGDKLPEEDIESLTERVRKGLEEFEEVVFGDPNLLKLEDIGSICESLQHQRDVEVRRGKDGVGIVELTKKKKAAYVAAVEKPGAVYRQTTGSITEKVNHMTVR